MPQMPRCEDEKQKRDGCKEDPDREPSHNSEDPDRSGGTGRQGVARSAPGQRTRCGETEQDQQDVGPDHRCFPQRRNHRPRCVACRRLTARVQLQADQTIASEPELPKIACKLQRNVRRLASGSQTPHPSAATKGEPGSRRLVLSARRSRNHQNRSATGDVR